MVMPSSSSSNAAVPWPSGAANAPVPLRLSTAWITSSAHRRSTMEVVKAFASSSSSICDSAACGSSHRSRKSTTAAIASPRIDRPIILNSSFTTPCILAELFELLSSGAHDGFEKVVERSAGPYSRAGIDAAVLVLGSGLETVQTRVAGQLAASRSMRRAVCVARAKESDLTSLNWVGARRGPAVSGGPNDIGVSTVCLGRRDAVGNGAEAAVEGVRVGPCRGPAGVR